MKPLILLPALLATTLCTAQAIEYSATYEANEEPTLATPRWQEIKGGKKSEGTVSVANGKLLVTVPSNARHYFAIGQSGSRSQRGDGAEVYNGTSPAGTTVDLAVTVTADDPEMAVFGVHLGSANGGVFIYFSPNGLTVNGRKIPQGTTEPDVYRFAFNEETLAVYSARRGELYRGAMRQTPDYPHNALFFGTLAPMNLTGPGEWEVDFVRWTHAGAEFSPPRIKDAAH